MSLREKIQEWRKLNQECANCGAKLNYEAVQEAIEEIGINGAPYNVSLFCSSYDCQSGICSNRAEDEREGGGLYWEIAD